MTITRTLLGLLTAVALGGCGGGASPPAAGSPPAAVGNPAPAAGNPAPAAPASGAVGNTHPVAEVNASGMGGAFNPPMLQIHVGDAVEWTNSSGNIHNVTFAPPSTLKSPIMYGGERWSQVFTTAGTYRYTCTFHPGMEGVIVVS